MTTKQPTPQGISALLRKAGFKRSESSTSRVRGFRNRSAGFVVSRRSDGEVAVYHETGFFMIDDAIEGRRAEQEGRYADAIEEAGYTVERGAGGMFAPVVVRAKADRKPAETEENR